MAKLSEEKIPHKVFRIVCLCLIVVIIGAVIGVYFLTKKSVNSSYDKYKTIVAQDIKNYNEKSLFNKDGTIYVSYQKSPELAQAVAKTYTQKQKEEALKEANFGDSTKLNEIEAVEKFNLLQNKYAPLLKFSNTYFTSYAKVLAESKKTTSRSKMNNLYKQVEGLQEKVVAFEKDKASLERATNTGNGSFMYTDSNVISLLKQHMVSYADLIGEFIQLNKTFAKVHLEIEGLTYKLDGNNAKKMVNFAIMYAINYIYVSEFVTINNSSQYFNKVTDNEIFNLIVTLYNKNQNNIVASSDLVTYNYLVERVNNVYTELDNVNECALQVKANSKNELYKNVLEGYKQDVLTFLDGVTKIIV